MMFLFRSAFVTAAFACVFVVLGQFATVHAAPQLGMRPNLHVYGFEGSGSEIASFKSSSATIDVGSASSTIVSAAEAAETAETTQLPDSSSSDDTGTGKAAQTNAAVSSACGLRVALFISSIAAMVQIF